MHGRAESIRNALLIRTICAESLHAARAQAS